MVTTREALETMETDYGMPDPSQASDAYEDLRNATPEERLEAVIWFLRQTVRPAADIEEAIAFLRTGFDLARPGGWERVAPMWLRESQKAKRKDAK